MVYTIFTTLTTVLVKILVLPGRIYFMAKVKPQDLFSGKLTGYCFIFTLYLDPALIQRWFNVTPDILLGRLLLPFFCRVLNFALKPVPAEAPTITRTTTVASESAFALNRASVYIK